MAKRLLDIALALVLTLILIGPSIGVAIWLYRRQGRPIFYGAERMAAPGRASATVRKIRAPNGNGAG